MRRHLIAIACGLSLSLAPGCDDPDDGDGDGVENNDDGGEIDAAIVAAGYSFGECAGGCVGNLTIGDDDALVMTVEDWSAQVLVENTGSLTVDGRSLLDAAAAELAEMTLQATYGCPDCDDGGASRIDVRVGEASSSHAYEFANPPPELTSADNLTTQIINALRDCVDADLVIVDEGCTPP